MFLTLKSTPYMWSVLCPALTKLTYNIAAYDFFYCCFHFDISVKRHIAEKSPQLAEILQIAQSKIVNRCSLYKP